MRNAARAGVLSFLLCALVASCQTDPFEPMSPNAPPVASLGSGNDTLVAAHDTYVRSASRNSNYGTHDTIRVRSIGGSSDTNRVLLSFDQSSIATALSGRSLTSATLIVKIKTVSNVGAGGVDIDVHRVLRSWTQTTATWNCAQDSNTGNTTANCPSASWQMSGSGQNAFASTRTARVRITNGQSGSLSFDLTADVNAFMAGTSNLGWLIKVGPESQSARVVLRSKETAVASDRPRLVLLSSSSGPPQPPDTVPAWFHHDTSFSATGFRKRIVGTVFKPSATQTQRQAAIAQVNGVVVGGERYSDGDGIYYLSITDDGSGTQLRAAEAALMASVHVEAAFLDYKASPGYLRPLDGPFYELSSWQLSPDSASGANWALEAIDAPFAWGCNTGDPSTNVAVVDHLFDSTDVIKNARLPLPRLGASPGESFRHGNFTSNIMAARGNDSSGMTGVMWQASVQLLDPGSFNVGFGTVARFAEKAAQAGAKVVNLSWYRRWANQPAPTDTAVTNAIVRVMMTSLRRLQTAGKLPLLVVIAGNDSIDARWAGPPLLRDSFPNNLIVVGAIDSGFNRPAFSNTGSLVDIYAPGMDVGTLDRSGLPVRVTGTSFAAPYVSGVGGLLLAFDSRLTTADLRGLILQGADSGGRTVAGTGKKVLNAYETLKVAARRTGAPICGNRIWMNGDAITVQRTSSVDEILAHVASGIGSGPEDPFGLRGSHHGGHRIDYMIVQGDRSLTFSQGQWRAGVRAGVGSPNGVVYSGLGHSHDVESYVFTRQLVYNEDPQGRPATVGLYILDNVSGQERELHQFQGFHMSGQGGEHSATYGPQGNVVLVGIRPGDGLGPSFDVYRVPLPSGNPVKLWSTIAGPQGLAITEDGKEAVFQHESYPNPGCTVEFRALPSGAMLRSFHVDAPFPPRCGLQSTAAFRTMTRH